MSTGTISDEDVQWFDADDAPEEYVIEEPEVEDALLEPQIMDDTESGDDRGYETPAPATEGEEEVKRAKKPVKRRTHLPAPIAGDEMSLLNVLRKNVGKVWDYVLILYTSN